MFDKLLNYDKPLNEAPKKKTKTPVKTKKLQTPKVVTKEPVAAPAVCPTCNPLPLREEMRPPGSYLRDNGLLMLVDKFDQEKIMPIVAQIYEYNLMPDDMQPEHLTLMAGDRRLVTHNTSVMSHQFSWGSQGKEHELKAIVKEFDMAGTRMIDHYKKCTKKSETYIRKNLLNPTDAWLSPEDCVKHGIIDEVVTTY
jgi:hypothetical protein